MTAREKELRERIEVLSEAAIEISGGLLAGWRHTITEIVTFAVTNRDPKTLREIARIIDEATVKIDEISKGLDKFLPPELQGEEMPSDGPYERSDPKHPQYHSTHADLWDMREGK